MARYLVCSLGFVLFALAGCHSCRRVDFSANRPPCNGCGDAGASIRLSPRPGLAPTPYQPPPSTTEGPQQATHVEPRSSAQPEESRPTETPRQSNQESTPSPTTPGEDESPVILKGPVPLRREAARPRSDTDEPPIANVPRPKSEEKRKKDSPRENDSEKYARLNLVNALPNVDLGLIPDPDQLALLKQDAYTAVLDIRDFRVNRDSQRQTVEKHRLNYLSIEIVGTEPLDATAYEQFVKIVNDKNNHPLFVYDRGERIAAGLWYLYFRLHKNESDEKARVIAKKLGLDFSSTEDDHLKVVLKVQKFLETYTGRMKDEG